MVIVDATVWIDYLRGHDNPETLWLEEQLALQPLGITDLTLCEVLQGVRDYHEFKSTRDALLKCDIFTLGGSDLAIGAARNYIKLRERGVTVRKTIDCIVATFCVAGGHELLHRDRDFDGFERLLGLKVVHP